MAIGVPGVPGIRAWRADSRWQPGGGNATILFPTTEDSTVAELTANTTTAS